MPTAVTVFPCEVLLPSGKLLRRARADLAGDRLTIRTETGGIISVDLDVDVTDVTGVYGYQVANRARRIHAISPDGPVHVTGVLGGRCCNALANL